MKKLFKHLVDFMDLKAAEYRMKQHSRDLQHKISYLEDLLVSATTQDGKYPMGEIHAQVDMIKRKRKSDEEAMEHMYKIMRNV